MKWAALRWLREMGLLLLIVSLFLPWFLDPLPEPGRSPHVLGIEVLAHHTGTTVVYTLALLSYGLSRFSTYKWAGAISLIAAWPFLFLLPFSAIMSFHNFDRPLSTVYEFQVSVLFGINAICIGFLALAIGLAAAEYGRGRSGVLLASGSIVFGLITLFAFLT